MSDPPPKAPSPEFPTAFPATPAAPVGTPPATGAAPRAPDGRRPASAVQVATVAATVGALVGFSLGVFVGAAGGRREAVTQAAPALDAKRVPAAPATPSGAAALRLDVGSAEDAAKLGGAFRAHEVVDGRTVALVGKDSASVTLFLPATAGSYLSFVARALGTETGKPLEMTARLSGSPLATLRVADHFELVGVALPAAEAGSAIALALAGDPGGEAAVAIDRIDVEPLSDRVHWDLSQPTHRARLLTGFYAPEGVGTPDATVWSAGLRSTLGVVLDPAHGEYEFVVNGRAFDASAPTDVVVYINDRSVGVVKLNSAPGDVSLTIPEGVLHTGANEIAFGYPKTFRPSQVVAGSKDERDLAMNFSSLDVRPK